MSSNPRIAERHPDSYTIGMPQILFSPMPVSGNYAMWVDWRALASAAFGLTNSDGKVVNSYGNVVGTPADIMTACYLGSLDGVNVGGDVETLEHTVANLGYEELDRVVVLQRPIEYALNFDEPDIKNLSRYFVSQETDLGLSLKILQVSGQVFKGSETDAVTIVERRLGDPSKALESITSLWQANGGTGTPPNGVYGFIVGGTNEDACVGAWEHKRQWIAYATFDFVAGTVGSWAYIRPKGTALNDTYGADALVPVNGAVHSIPDSNPVLNKCGGSVSWNVNAKLAWNGFVWVGADDGFFGYSIVGTRQSFKRTFGAALVFSFTEIGTSMLHVIPKCTLMPDGSMNFNPDSWMQGSFKLNVMRDNNAVFLDRTPALPVPFGYIQTMELPSGM